MTWNTLANLAANDLVTETHMDQIRENIEHLGGMKLGNTALSGLSTGQELGKLVTGTYTGDGGATKAITGVGFQPKMVMVWIQTTNPAGLKADTDGTKAKWVSSFYQDDHIISLDSNGFTVGDGTGSSNAFNVNSATYSYSAWSG